MSDDGEPAHTALTVQWDSLTQAGSPMTGLAKLDRLDIRILCQLQKNARITNVDMADAVGLSPSPCLSRLKRLEKAGYIAGYGAQLRLDKLADTLNVFTEITLGDHRREDFVRFELARNIAAKIYPPDILAFLRRKSDRAERNSKLRRPSVIDNLRVVFPYRVPL